MIHLTIDQRTKLRAALAEDLSLARASTAAGCSIGNIVAPALDHAVAPRVYVAPESTAPEPLRAPPLRGARPLKPPPRLKLPPAAKPRSTAPVRAPDDTAIAAFLAERGATRVPAVGDPALEALPPLRWDPRTRKQTRRPANPGEPPRSWGHR